MTKAAQADCKRRANAVRKAIDILESEAALEDMKQRATGGTFQSSGYSYRRAMEVLIYLEGELRAGKPGASK